MKNIKTPPWYVLTGGPSCGKTTLIKKLKELGYHTIPEAARVLIDEYESRGIPAKELRKDENFFQNKVLQMKIENEDKAPKNEIVFFDRGVPDSIAYFQIDSMDTEKIKAISKNRYKKIFFLEKLPFEEDYARTEDQETVEKLNQLLLECYENLEYEIIFLPVVSVEERVEIILSNL